MRILHFYKDYFPDSMGGVEQVIRQLCVGTGRLGVRPEVLTLTAGDDLPPFELESPTVPPLPSPRKNPLPRPPPTLTVLRPGPAAVALSSCSIGPARTITTGYSHLATASSRMCRPL